MAPASLIKGIERTQKRRWCVVDKGWRGSPGSRNQELAGVGAGGVPLPRSPLGACIASPPVGKSGPSYVYSSAQDPGLVTHRSRVLCHTEAESADLFGDWDFQHVRDRIF
jgi:hypothetical protein